MDYRLNNEGIVACVAAQVVNCGFSKVSAVVIITNLLMHEAERKELKSSSESQSVANIMNHIDGGLLTIIINSLVMMIQGGCMEYAKGELTLTQAGYTMCRQMMDGRSHLLNSILKDIPAVKEKVDMMGMNLMNNKYFIAL